MPSRAPDARISGGMAGGRRTSKWPGICSARARFKRQAAPEQWFVPELAAYPGFWSRCHRCPIVPRNTARADFPDTLRHMSDAPDPWHFPRPALAQGLLETLGRGLTSARGLFASRRMGKTEFLLQDLVPAAHAARILTAYVNLWDDRQDPSAALVAAIAKAVKPGMLEKLLRDLRRPIKSIKASGNIKALGEASLEANFADERHVPKAALPLVLQELDRSRKVLLLVIDEAQVLTQAQHTDFAHALRAALDTRKQTVKVVFAGSSESTLRRMFARRSEPFFNWAPLEPFDLLGRPFAYAMVEKVNATTKVPLSATDALAAFEALRYTPEFFRRYLDRYLTHPRQGSAAALEHTQTHIFESADFPGQWRTLSTTEQHVLRMLAGGVTDLHGLEARKQLGIALGRKKEVSRSMPQHALRHLLERGVLARVEQGDYRFEDETFADWIRTREPELPFLV